MDCSFNTRIALFLMIATAAGSDQQLSSYKLQFYNGTHFSNKLPVLKINYKKIHRFADRDLSNCNSGALSSKINWFSIRWIDFREISELGIKLVTQNLRRFHTQTKRCTPQQTNRNTWISFSPNTLRESNFSKLFRTVLDVSSAIGDTDTTVFLHCSNNHPLPGYASAKSAHSYSYSYKKSIKFGLIFKTLNCTNFSKIVDAVQNSIFSTIIFQIDASSQSEAKLPTSLIICPQNLTSRTINTTIGFITEVESVRNHTYTNNPQDFIGHDSVLDKKVWQESGARSKTKNVITITSTTINSSDIDFRLFWSKSNLEISKKYFGVTVNLQTISNLSSNFSLSNITSLVLGNFSVLHFQDDSAGNTKLLEKLLANIVKIKMTTKNGSKKALPKQMPMQNLLLVRLSNYREISKNISSIQTAVNITKYANSLYPGTVKGILLDYKTLDNEVDPHNSNWIHMLWEDSIVHTITYSKFALKHHMVGVVLPIEFCLYYIDYPRYRKWTGLETLDILIFQVKVTRENIQDGTHDLFKYFHQCQSSILRETGNSSQVQFRVTPLHCNQSEIADLLNYWEEIRMWSTKDKTVVVVDTAFDSPTENQTCGWWSVSLNEFGTYDFKDKHYSISPLSLTNSNITDLQSSSKIRSDITKTMLYILVPTFSLITLLGIAISYLIFRYRSKFIVSKREVNIFFKGIKEHQIAKCSEAMYIDFEGNGPGFNAYYQPYNKEKYETRSFSLDTSCCLGAGEFCTAWKGKLKQQESGCEILVAVKTMKEHRQFNKDCDTALKGLLSEIKVLSYVGEHQHIIALLGAYTAELRKGRVYVFLELCELGSLESYLRRQEKVERDRQNELWETENLGNKYTLDDRLEKDLLRWSGEICDGMEYLASKQVVHADLATRNVLLNGVKSAKISDFGLSRRLHDYTSCTKNSQEPLPWRWMSPESLRQLTFNQKTDVWAFGVVLWEIYSLGDKPYPGLSWDVKFVQCVEMGLRLCRPKYCDMSTYKVMQSCWEIDPRRRPLFSELKQMLFLISRT